MSASATSQPSRCSSPGGRRFVHAGLNAGGERRAHAALGRVAHDDFTTRLQQHVLQLSRIRSHHRDHARQYRQQRVGAGEGNGSVQGIAGQRREQLVPAPSRIEAGTESACQ